MRTLVLIAALLCSAAAAAQNTRKPAPGASPPAATVADLGWMVGHWAGEGLGGQSFETISPPVAGQMAGHFQQVKDGRLSFYEIYQFVPRGGSIVLRIKHFGPDLAGWEEKGAAVEFPLVAIEDGAAYFDGLTMRRSGTDGMESFVVIDHEDGRREEAAFRFKRVRD
jgi:hypothetical protein